MVSITWESTSPIRADEALGTSSDLLAKPASYGRATTRTPGLHMGGNEGSNARKVCPCLLSPDDYRRVAAFTSRGWLGSRLHRAV